MRVRRLLLVVALGGAAGCFGNSTTVFPPGLEPLEPDAVPEQQGGAYTETLVMQDQPFTTYNDVHGRGYVLAPPSTVWALSKNPDVMDQGCQETRHSSTVGDEPEYEYSFDMHYEVDEVITVSWDEQWRFGTVVGTPEMPTDAMVRYQKVSGTDFIKVLEGSAQYFAVPDDPNVTMIEFIEHVNAQSFSTSDTHASMQLRFDSTVALAHGQPLPPCP